MIALRAVVIPVQVISIIFMKKSITAAASGVMVLIAVMTESSVFVPVTIVCPDDRAAAVAGSGMPLVAVCAYNLAIYFLIILVLADKRSAVSAIQRICVLFFHF